MDVFSKNIIAFIIQEKLKKLTKISCINKTNNQNEKKRYFIAYAFSGAII